MIRVHKIEWKPILVFYVPSESLIREHMPNIKKYAEDNGYDLLIWGGASREGVEIISVDKETVVSNIQEWIDKTIKDKYGEDLSTE